MTFYSNDKVHLRPPICNTPRCLKRSSAPLPAARPSPAGIQYWCEDSWAATHTDSPGARCADYDLGDRLRRFPNFSRESGTGSHATPEYNGECTAGLKRISPVRHCAGNKGIVGRSSGRSIFRDDNVAVSGKARALLKLLRTNVTCRSAKALDDRSRRRPSSKRLIFLCDFLFL